MRFKIDWVSLIVGRKFTGFALVYFVFEGNFQVQALGGGGGGGAGGLISAHLWSRSRCCQLLSWLIIFFVRFH